ncbi:MAG TPA: helix-turn-helix domain-containing protein [Polyangia bacterium]|nr:helix-turn-helix domain-containing protein [Polyangia bacterium]
MTTLDSPARVTMDAKEVASMFGLPVATIYAMVRTQKIPSFRVGTRVLFLKETIEEMMDEGRRRPGPDSW